MNAKEGMRRVGLVAGVLGACVGSYVSYTYSVALLEQRHQHEEFQSLASSPVVRQEVLFLKNNLSLSKAAKTPRDASAKDPLHKAPEKVLADDDPNNPFNASKPGTPATPRPQDEFDAALKKPEPDEFDKILAKSDKSDKTKPGEIPSPVSAAGTEPSADPVVENASVADAFQKADDAVDAIGGGSKGWRIDEGGIKKIYFRPDGELKAIEKDDGVTVYASSSPPLWSYLLALVPTILGFLLPWGSLAVLTWVGTGFFQKPK